jgi:hypothetical protein
MGWNRTRSSNSGEQVAATRGTASGINLSAASTRANRNEKQANWRILDTSGSGHAGWGDFLLNLARALAAQPAA